MADLMTRDRFQQLAEAYGGVIARWPSEYRAAAMQLAQRPEATAILMDALALDEILDEWRAPLPSAGLVAGVFAARPVRRRLSRMRLWWSGIGIATTLAGAAAGMAAVAILAPVDSPQGVSTSFGDVAGRDV